MLHDENSMAADRANRSQRKGGTDVRPMCLLCRVRFPLVVEHRYLLFDGIRKQRRPFVRSCAPEDSQSAGRLLFHYSEEISIDGSSSS
ncbi:MAG: hypothetical protein QOG23_3625 [Blastocatellia bacterium]|nr:hypothetical protein [Blastocatellia bacterium]